MIKWKCHSSQNVSLCLECTGKPLQDPHLLCSLPLLQYSMPLPVPLEAQSHLTHYGGSPVSVLSVSSGAVHLSSGSDLALKNVVLEKSQSNASPSVELAATHCSKTT